MLRKDLLVRQFEEFGKVMAIIFGHKRLKDWEEFQKEIEEAAKKITSFEIIYVESLLPEIFESEILLKEDLIPEKQKMLADLLYEKMDFYLERNDLVKYRDLKNKCLLLYKRFSENLTVNEFNLDVHYKLSRLTRPD